MPSSPRPHLRYRRLTAESAQRELGKLISGRAGPDPCLNKPATLIVELRVLDGSSFFTKHFRIWSNSFSFQKGCDNTVERGSIQARPTKSAYYCNTVKSEIWILDRIPNCYSPNGSLRARVKMMMAQIQTQVQMKNQQWSWVAWQTPLDLAMESYRFGPLDQTKPDKPGTQICCCG